MSEIKKTSKLKFDTRYTPCTVLDIATRLNMSKATLWKWMNIDDMVALCQEGWKPGVNLLSPKMVKIFVDRFMDFDDDAV